MPASTIRYDEQTKREVTPLLDSIGLSINAYLNLALRQLAIQKRVPFALYGSPSAVSPQPIFEASPTAKKVDGRLVFPADWDDGDDE